MRNSVFILVFNLIFSYGAQAQTPKIGVVPDGQVGTKTDTTPRVGQPKPGAGNSLPFRASMETSEEGFWFLPVCDSGLTAGCPWAQTIIIEAWGSGGDGGASSKEGGGGAGGGAGGYIKTQYQIPGGTTRYLTGAILRNDGSTLGETTFETDSTVLGSAFAGYTGQNATTIGGSGSQYNHSNAGTYQILSPQVLLLDSGNGGDGSAGQSGSSVYAHQPADCRSYFGGDGASSYWGYGDGGHGGSVLGSWITQYGGACRTDQLDANQGGNGHIKISWDTNIDPGQHGSVDFSNPGAFLLNLCTGSPTSTCPTALHAMTIELWGAGGGGQDGYLAVGGGAAGGASGSSGKYLRFLYIPPVNVTAVSGNIGVGGVGGVSSLSPATSGNATSVYFVGSNSYNQNPPNTSGQVYNSAVASGGAGARNSLCTTQIQNSSSLNQDRPSCWNWIDNISLQSANNFTQGKFIQTFASSFSPIATSIPIWNIPSIDGQDGAHGAMCSGGDGGIGRSNRGFGAGGDGGHGGYYNNFITCTQQSLNNGRTFGQNGQNGHVRISW